MNLKKKEKKIIIVCGGKGKRMGKITTESQEVSGMLNTFFIEVIKNHKMVASNFLLEFLDLLSRFFTCKNINFSDLNLKQS